MQRFKKNVSNVTVYLWELHGVVTLVSAHHTSIQGSIPVAGKISLALRCHSCHSLKNVLVGDMSQV